MRFVAPSGHERVIEGLLRAAREDRLAHALCFVGPAGSGKFLAAEWLALGLVCSSDVRRPCGACGPCKRARAGTHPDLFAIDPEEEGEEEIKITRIARRGDSGPNVGDFLSLEPMEGGWRIVLVREADRLNEEAQNALLKTLEEPGDDTLLVLVTSRPDALLPTIHSRCVRVRFDAPGEAVTRAVLAREGPEDLADADARACARWSRGAPGQALAYARANAPEMRALLVRVLSGELRRGAALEAFDELDGEFPARTPSGAARAKARVLLDLAIDVLADLRRARAGLATDSLAHGDLATASWVPSATRLERQLEETLVARQDVDLNLAPDAAIERALSALEPANAARFPTR